MAAVRFFPGWDIVITRYTLRTPTRGRLSNIIVPRAKQCTGPHTYTSIYLLYWNFQQDQCLSNTKNAMHIIHRLAWNPYTRGLPGNCPACTCVKTALPPTLPEHINSPCVFCGIRIAQSFCVAFCRFLFVFFVLFLLVVGLFVLERFATSNYSSDIF